MGYTVGWKRMDLWHYESLSSSASTEGQSLQKPLWTNKKRFNDQKS